MGSGVDEGYNTIDKINLVPLSKRKAEAISEIEFDYFFVETRLRVFPLLGCGLHWF